MCSMLNVVFYKSMLNDQECENGEDDQVGAKPDKFYKYLKDAEQELYPGYLNGISNSLLSQSYLI